MGIEDILEGLINLWIGSIVTAILLAVLYLVYSALRPTTGSESQQMMDKIYASGTGTIELLGLVGLLSFAVLVVLYIRNK